jgi:hypothetical protein
MHGEARKDAKTEARKNRSGTKVAQNSLPYHYLSTGLKSHTKMSI